MAKFLIRFAGEPKAEGCGLTVDSHRTNNDFDVVQYLWAAPLESLSDSKIDDITGGIINAAKRSGFTPGEVSPYVTNLPNESAVLDSCPFQPGMCTGQHLVVSGSGKAT